MINAITSALSGLNKASAQVEQSAQNIAESGTNGTSQSDLIEDVIDIKVAETSYKANIAVLKVADELTQELLNSFDNRIVETKAREIRMAVDPAV